MTSNWQKQKTTYIYNNNTCLFRGEVHKDSTNTFWRHTGGSLLGMEYYFLLGG